MFIVYDSGLAFNTHARTICAYPYVVVTPKELQTLNPKPQTLQALPADGLVHRTGHPLFSTTPNARKVGHALRIEEDECWDSLYLISLIT